MINDIKKEAGDRMQKCIDSLKIALAIAGAALPAARAAATRASTALRGSGG